MLQNIRLYSKPVHGTLFGGIEKKWPKWKLSQVKNAEIFWYFDKILPSIKLCKPIQRADPSIYIFRSSRWHSNRKCPKVIYEKCYEKDIFFLSLLDIWCVIKAIVNPLQSICWDLLNMLLTFDAVCKRWMINLMILLIFFFSLGQSKNLPYSKGCKKNDGERIMIYLWWWLSPGLYICIRYASILL